MKLSELKNYIKQIELTNIIYENMLYELEQSTKAGLKQFGLDYLKGLGANVAGQLAGGVMGGPPGAIIGGAAGAVAANLYNSHKLQNKINSFEFDCAKRFGKKDSPQKIKCKISMLSKIISILKSERSKTNDAGVLNKINKSIEIYQDRLYNEKRLYGINEAARYGKLQSLVLGPIGTGYRRAQAEKDTFEYHCNELKDPERVLECKKQLMDELKNKRNKNK